MSSPGRVRCLRCGGRLGTIWPHRPAVFTCVNTTCEEFGGNGR